MKRTLLAAALAFAVSLPAAAENLLHNPSFAQSLSGWTTVAGTTAAFDPTDAGGLSYSGSARLSAAAANGTGALSQCVVLPASTSYSLAVRVRLAAGSAANGYPFASYAYYSDAACGTRLPSNADTAAGGSAEGAWGIVFIPAITRPAAPTGAQSALVTIGVQNRSAGPFPEILFDDVLFAPYRPQTVTIPASASIHGQNNAFFQTDLWLVNGSSVLTAPVLARHYCFSGQTCGGGVKTANVPPRGTLQYHDVLGTLFADPATAGAIELTFDTSLSRVTALSRTYSPSLPAPTTGSALPALEEFEARLVSVLPGLASNGGDLGSGFRTNVGAYNPTNATAQVTFTAYAENGTQIGSPVVKTLAPNEAIQVNDLFGSAGAPSLVTTNAYAVVTSNFEVFSYATIIDNKSTDSMIVTGQPDQTSLYP